MARFLYLDQARNLRNFCVVILALSWCLGLSFGFSIYQNSGASIVSLMGMAVSSHVSFVGTLIPFLLPFLLSAAAVYLCLPRLLSAICFCKAFLFAFVTCGLLGFYGSAGWLVQLLFMFGDICFSCLLFLYWLRHTSGERKFSVKETVSFLFAGIAIAGTDYFVISPFLQGVFLI